MAVYLTPGVKIEEIKGGARPIEGVATSVAAFVGPATRGPAGDAVLIGSLSDYKKEYGDITSTDDAMGIAVQSFYLNGGKDAYICRIAGHGAKPASTNVVGEGTFADDGGRTPTSEPVLKISANSVGKWGEDLFVKIDKPDPDAIAFDLRIGHHEDGKFVEDESYAGLTMGAGDPHFAPGVVNADSKRVTLELGDAADPEHASQHYQAATIVGGHTGTEDDWFSAALADQDEATLSLGLNDRGLETVRVELAGTSFDGTDHDTDATALAAAVQAAIRAHSTLLEFQRVTVGYADGRFTVTSPEDDSAAALTIGEGTLARLMRLGPDARAVLIGQAQPSNGNRFTSGSGFAAQDTYDIVLAIDGSEKVAVTLNPSKVDLVSNNSEDGKAIAAHIRTAVRNAEPDRPGFRRFACTYSPGREFVLSSGSLAPRATGITVDDSAMADFLRIQSSETEEVTAIDGRVVNQGVAQVIPVATPGPGDEGVQLTGGVSVAPAGEDYGAFFGTVLRKRRDVTMIVLPKEPWTKEGTTPAISQAIAHAETMKNRMLLIDPPKSVEFADASVFDQIQLPPTSTYVVMYYPWVSVPNPLYDIDKDPTGAKTALAPPSAFAAGIWAKTDWRRGVWKAPAGVETRLVGATSLEYEVEDTEQAQLNPLGINCFRKVPTFGQVVWGARTRATSSAPEWRYVPVRRTAIFIEQSIYNGIQWAVFEPNKHTLWAALRASIGGFMNGLFRAGAFQGETADDAYFVRCNLGDTMSQADIDRGQVIVVVGFAPVKPAEFVVVRIQQKVGQE